jgi:putative ABC transport system permease protein
MSFFKLVLVNLGRNKRRTILTMLSVMVALFLFCALGGVLDTLQSTIKVSSETRLISRNAMSLVFPLPLSYRDRIAMIPGVTSLSHANWFGGQDPNDPHNFFPQFAIDAATYLPLYANDVAIVDASPAPEGTPVPAGLDPKLAAFMVDQTGAIVGEELMKQKGWKVGQTITVAGTIFPGNWPMTIRAVYRPKNKIFGARSVLFHWKYLSEHGMGGGGYVGWYVLGLSNPNLAGETSKQVDALFENSAAATHTETERAFQAGFISMYGNLPFVIKVVGLAVVFSILLIAANTMMMAFRERTTEIGVFKTLGFEDGTIFRLVLTEAAVITLVGGSAGALLAKWLITGFSPQVLPPMVVAWTTVGAGLGVALLLGAVSGLLPAWQASRLKIVDALRRV